MKHRTLLRFPAITALMAVGLTACERLTDMPLDSGPAEDVTAQASHAGAANDADVSAWLAGVRAATAAFHDIDAAAAAGYDVRITGCMELPGTGAMGYHYGNIALIDGVPEEFAPELLVYAPQQNGKLRLVAVEFIVPFDAWTETDPPSLHGIAFHPNTTFGLWALHAWIWDRNPAGVFADWNPTVSCEFAS